MIFAKKIEKKLKNHSENQKFSVNFNDFSFFFKKILQTSLKVMKNLKIRSIRAKNCKLSSGLTKFRRKMSRSTFFHWNWVHSCWKFEIWCSIRTNSVIFPPGRAPKGPFFRPEGSKRGPFGPRRGRKWVNRATLLAISTVCGGLSTLRNGKSGSLEP